MKLHTRLVLLLAVTFGIFLSIAVSIIYSVVQPAFEQLEQAEAAKNVLRVQRALASELATIDQKLLDWADWDDTKEFVLDRTPEYIDGNLNASTIINLNLSFMAFYDLQGMPVWTGGYDPETEELIVTPELSDPTLIGPFLSKPDAPVEILGLWAVGSGNYLVSARPVLDSQSAGPVSGTLVFGRLVDDALVSQLREQTEVQFAIAALPPGHAAEALPTDKPKEVSRSNETLNHSIAWHDLASEPRARIDVDTPREINALGNHTITLTMTLLVSAALIDMVVIGLAVSFLVARPVRALTRQITEIAKSGDLSVRLAWTRRDELGALAAQFDRMLGELADARQMLQEMSYKIGRSDVASGVLHNVRNALSPLANQIQRGRQILATPAGAHVAQAITQLGDPATPSDRRVKLAEYLTVSMDQEAALRQTAADELTNAAQGLSTVEHILAHQQSTADLEVAPQDFALSEIVNEVLRQTATAAQGVAINVSPSVERAPKVRAHQTIAVHVLHNVLANAVTAVETAGRADRRIEITAHFPSDKGQVVLEIRDNGVGITPEQMSQLFHNGFTTKPGAKGGDGLHWCANALAKLKGRIWAESKGRGEGAAFFIEFTAA
jgi:sensor domain CHASE-containing protein